MGIKQLYNDNLRKLPNEYGDVSVMVGFVMTVSAHLCHALADFRFPSTIINTILISLRSLLYKRICYVLTWDDPSDFIGK